MATTAGRIALNASRQKGCSSASQQDGLGDSLTAGCVVHASLVDGGDLAGALPVVVLGLPEAADEADNEGGADGSQVARQHGVIAAQVVDVDLACTVSTGKR